MAGYITTDDIESSLYASDEFMRAHDGTPLGFVQALYSELLQRPGGSAEWSGWVKLANARGRASVVAAFWNAPETVGHRVQAMYQFYLDRQAGQWELAGWVSDAATIGDSGLRASITGGVEYANRAQWRFVEQ